MCHTKVTVLSLGCLMLKLSDTKTERSITQILDRLVSRERKSSFMEMNTTKNKTVIAILFGGCATEYEVSLQSAYSVITHLNQEKYEAHLIGITREGTWLC